MLDFQTRAESDTCPDSVLQGSLAIIARDGLPECSKTTPCERAAGVVIHPAAPPAFT